MEAGSFVFGKGPESHVTDTFADAERVAISNLISGGENLAGTQAITCR